MIYIIIGLVILVLFLCLHILRLQGYRITKDHHTDIPKDQREEAQRKIDDFDKIMNYSLDQALQRKRG